jgi:hypothetical protein
MADIYALAESVVVWLGPEADESSFALRTLDTLGSMVDTNWSAFTMKPSHEASAAGQLHWADWTVKMPFKSRELDPIHHLLERPWFERLWIQQEIALATEAILISGFESIAWSRFRNAIFCLYIKVREQKQVVSKFGIFWDRITLIHNFCEESHGYTMVQQLIRTNYCKCADPRDRIFALLSISKLPIGVEIKADYRKSTEELYQEVALEYYKRYLYMLTFCELQNSRAGKPTWVPNWATRRLTCDLPTARAGGNSNPLVQYMGGNVLRVIGIRVARINSADPVRVPGMLYKEAVAAIQRHAPPPSDLKSSLDIYCRTLHCDLFGNWHDPPIARHENFEECREALRSLLDIDRAPTSTVQKRAFINAAITYIMHRSIFWTDDGRMGLGPGLAQATDEIVVFPGCPAPMMLRPSSNGRYQVIGECFIHDLMDSEALLGPRPEHYQQRVRKLPEGAQMYYEAYRDNQTGQIQDEDPRLGSLPSRLRDDGVRQIYPTGLPRGGEERDYMGWLTWTKRWVGDGDMVEVMRNDLRPFLLE